MASTELKHRKTDDSASPTVPAADNGTAKKAKNKAIAKRGLKSLALAISIPVSLTLLSIFLLSNPKNYFSASAARPFWVPSTKVVNWGSLTSSLLMGVAAWLVWAEGGFHARPNALYLYSLYLALCVAWYGLVLGAGARWLGSLACLGKTAALVGCDRLFRGVNPIAADLLKPCLVWSVFLTVVNLTMASL
ncbi:unnamed protein product [Citrullus colocynthis]|uniref:Translocator protein homolog n=1 Tax=Citrullus colocynthis TaxID=252529 RepID=A0ABP0XQW9_9ROSI